MTTTNNTLITDFAEFTRIIVGISNHTYLFKTLESLESRNTVDEMDPTHRIITLLSIVLITLLMCLAAFKMIVIYLSYYFVFITKTMRMLIRTLIKTKCKIKLGLILTKVSKSALSHLKTFYTHNFYSYVEPITGVLLMLLYLIFILSNIGMSFIYFITSPLSSSEIAMNMIYIIGFLPQLFLQIYIPFFYYKRKKNKFSLFFSTSFAFWFFVIGMIAYIFKEYEFTGADSSPAAKDKTQKDIENIISITFSIGLHIFLFVSQVLAILKMFRYNLNRKSMRMVLAETKRKNNELFDQSVIDKEELKTIASKYHLDKFYYDSNSEQFFEMKDRFHRKKLLLFLFILYALTNIFIVIILHLLFKIAYQKYSNRNYNISTLKLLSSQLQIGLLIETFILNLIAWLTFMKIEISTVYLY